MKFNATPSVLRCRDKLWIALAGQMVSLWVRSKGVALGYDGSSFQPQRPKIKASICFALESHQAGAQL